MYLDIVAECIALPLACYILTVCVCRSLASGSGDTTVRLWDIFTETPLHTCKGHKHWILCITWSPDGRRLASGCKNGQVTPPPSNQDTSSQDTLFCPCVSRCVCGTQVQGHRWEEHSLDTSSGSHLWPGNLCTCEWLQHTLLASRASPPSLTAGAGIQYCILAPGLPVDYVQM